MCEKTQRFELVDVFWYRNFFTFQGIYIARFSFQSIVGDRILLCPRP